jgi:hypothetical protein
MGSIYDDSPERSDDEAFWARRERLKKQSLGWDKQQHEPPPEPIERKSKILEHPKIEAHLKLEPKSVKQDVIAYVKWIEELFRLRKEYGDRQ